MSAPEDIHTICFRAGLDGDDLPWMYVGHAYAEMSYRDGCEERRRRELVGGEPNNAWRQPA